MLRENLVDCSTESCWLKELKNSRMMNKIKTYVFAPEQPPEWKNNPNEWLSNFDMLEVMDQYEQKYNNFEFIGPSTIDFDKILPDKRGKCVEDELCNFSLEDLIRRKKDKIGIIFNLDEYTGSGTHWVSMFVDISNKFIFFFDSAGTRVPKEIKVLANRIIKQGMELPTPIKFIFKQNYPKEHQYGASECGMYSLFCIITFLTGEVESKKFSTSKEIIDYFKEKRIPDKYIHKYRNVYFNETL